jgi:hypothetical protein
MVDEEKYHVVCAKCNKSHYSEQIWNCKLNDYICMTCNNILEGNKLTMQGTVLSRDEFRKIFPNVEEGYCYDEDFNNNIDYIDPKKLIPDIFKF